MTKALLNTPAETSFVEQSGWIMLYDIQLRDSDVKLIRWAVQVACNVVAAEGAEQSGQLSRQESINMLNQLNDAEEYLADQVLESMHKSSEPSVDQEPKTDGPHLEQPSLWLEESEYSSGE